MAEARKARFPLHFSLWFSAIFVLLYWPGIILLSTEYEGVFKHLEDVWIDKLFDLRRGSTPSGDPRIIVVAIDSDTGNAVDKETGQRFGFPLPRKVHAKLISRLKDYGVKTLIFDVLFIEPREGDRELIEETKKFKRVVHLFATETKQTEGGEVVAITLPLSGLVKSAQYLGYPNVERVLDNDGHVRRAVVFDDRTHDPMNPDQHAPSMDAVAYASFLGRPLSEVRERYAEPKLKRMIVNFRAPRTMLRHQKRDEKLVGKVQNLQEVDSPYNTISMMDVINGDLTPAQKKGLKGSLVLVGSTALGYYDHYPTPFIPEAPGVEYHANILDNMLHEDFLGSLSRGWILLAILFMIWFPMLLHRFPPMVGAPVAGAVFVGWFAFAYWEFTQGIRVNFVSPLIALLSAFMVQTVHRVLTEGAEKKFIKDVFGQFVAPEVVADLVKDPGKVKLGGEKRDMTIFFLDIAHFTTISEKMTPESLIIFLNKYLSALSHIVHEQKGVVDKYIGDCIMAFWNAPIELPDHRARACLAAIGCQEMMKELNKNLDPTLPEIPKVRIGLNSGFVTVGLTGSEKKLQYTVIGDEVNLASRLEGANKFFGSGIMASESTYAGAKDAVEARELGRVRVVGKVVPIRVYELLAKKGQLSEDWKKSLPHYEKGFAHFNKREYDQAAVCFQEVVKVFPKDGPANYYLSTSKDYLAIPPQADWDGVVNLTAK